MAETMEMPFGMWTWVRQRYHVLDGGPDPHVRSGKFEGRKGPPQDMPGSQYTQGDSAEGSTGTVQMPIGV